MYHMNRIDIDLDDDELLVQVECTALQLIRQPIVLHAMGFFVIDYSTLIRVSAKTRGVMYVRQQSTHKKCINPITSISVARRHHDLYGFLYTIRTETPHRQINNSCEGCHWRAPHIQIQRTDFQHTVILNTRAQSLFHWDESRKRSL